MATDILIVDGRWVDTVIAPVTIDMCCVVCLSDYLLLLSLSYHRHLTMISEELELRVEGGQVGGGWCVCVVSRGRCVCVVSRGWCVCVASRGWWCV